MGAVTLTYSETSKGWPSFYSFIPEKMVGMNNYLYSFKGGKLYRHNTNPKRNNFYDVQHSSTISSIFNIKPLEVKLFKTIYLESDSAWAATYNSDMHNPGGSLLASYFVQKETDWFSFLRADENTVNFNLRSANGLGDVSSVDSSVAAAVVLTFTFDVGSIISIGDKAYHGNTPTFAGEIVATTTNTITINTTSGGSVPPGGAFICYIKDSVAESHGVRGHYLEFTLTNGPTENPNSVAVELFAVKSSMFKSYP
tara:strand:+ start:3353 stop:4114 length:762 start_codon:yes stop_codon:yes gene_type:complete